MLKLFHSSNLVCVIRNELHDELAMTGDVDLTPQAATYKDVFAFFNDPEKRTKEDPPFADELLENWFVENEDGDALKSMHQQ